ncbi:hypothetical protein [Flavobacterium luteum]|uniref:Uncharacterized protein n=1 Tax=Flavobacterium luteum TaxID=2026654 RepID=A0A7J5A8Y4_9FLAO|nr:hypothetical protein [Flavobacterium luteum]KAB1154034.1 hypothetical protein F6464_13680 [Flavobacterium luteum]
MNTIELGNEKIQQGMSGGFFLREPNSSKKVEMLGKTVTKKGTLYLKLTSSLQANVSATVTEGDGFIEFEGILENLSGKDRELWLGFNLPINTIGWKWGQSLSNSPVITTDKPAYSERNNLVPIPAVWTDKGGIAMAIPPTNPCVFEVGADADGIRIQMAFGLSSSTTKFPSKAPFRFRIYTIDGTWGFRDALAKYYDWYPDYYQIDKKVMTALGHHHDWINMNFAKETFKTDRQIDPELKEYLAYTKTSARIQDIKNANTLKTNEQLINAIENATTIQHYEKKGDSKSPLIIEGRAALLNSIAYTPDGSLGTFKASDGGIDFPHNCDPDLFADKKIPVYANMYLRKATDLRKHGNFIGIHWDRLGGWSNFLNYRKDHFGYIDHPLTFDQEGRPCIHTQFTNYELFDAYRLQLKQGGLFHEAAGMKEYSWKKIPNKPAGQENGRQFFLASVVAGGWQEGSFKPIGLGGFDFERMLVGRKSYRISSGNIPQHKESPTLDVIKNAPAKTTAYGFACPVQVLYFYPPGHPGYDKDYSWYTKPDHKALWDRYEPANLAIRLAGWEPAVTYATSSSPAVQLQRFGKGKTIYLTVWGPESPDSVAITIDAKALGLSQKPTFSEIVSNTPMEISKNEKGWKLTVPMEKNMTRVIKISL